MNTVRLKLLAAALAAATFPATVWATNGYFTHGVSILDKGLAGAGAAYSQDTLAASNNPAGMVWQGKRYDIGATWFSPRRKYSATGGPALPAGGSCAGFPACPFSIGDGDQSIDSENESFLIPSFGYNWMLGGGDSSVGISLYGNGGMNTEYKGGTALFQDPTVPPPGAMIPAPAPGTYGDGTAGVDLAQMFISTTYAAKLSPTSSWGISGIIAYQRFEAKGLATFGGFSQDPGDLSDNDHDTSTGIGLRIGYQAEISPGFRFGASYQPKIQMSEFDDYAGLFAEDGDFDIPSTWTMGVSVDIGNDRMFVFDVQRINYEDVAAVSNPIDNLVSNCTPGPTGGTGDGCLGGSDGAGFGWENITVFKLGYQWTNDVNTWRLGYSRNEQPIPSSEVTFNILAPGIMREHITVGYSRQTSSNSSVDFSFMYAPAEEVDGTNTFDPTQEIELEMEQYELAISYNRRM
jgi:long-chain fatty acid transport protein